MTLGPIDHLTLDAVVAYADGEMPMVSYQRAAAHVARCPQCDAEVRAQVVARNWLRSAQAPSMPSGLLNTLRAIPVALPTTASGDRGSLGSPGPSTDRRPAGGRGLPDHQRIDRSVAAPPDQRNAHRSRRFRFLGTGALVAGLTVGVLVGAAESTGDRDPQPKSPQVAHVNPTAAPQVVTAGWGNH